MDDDTSKVFKYLQEKGYAHTVDTLKTEMSVKEMVHTPTLTASTMPTLPTTRTLQLSGFAASSSLFSSLVSGSHAVPNLT